MSLPSPFENSERANAALSAYLCYSDTGLLDFLNVTYRAYSSCGHALGSINTSDYRNASTISRGSPVKRETEIVRGEQIRL
jgi:hypothetical protein